MASQTLVTHYLLLLADLLVYVVDLAVDLGGGILGYTDIGQKQKRQYCAVHT